MSAIPNVLDTIAQSVRRRLAERKARLPLERLEEMVNRIPKPFLLADQDTQTTTPKIIAEVKFRSPSAGELASVHDAKSVAKDYLSSGAFALSVLTEQDHFSGSLNYLRQVRGEFPEARLLMKDFMLEEYQLHEALSCGADCILLIVALLGKDETRSMLRMAQGLGLEALVEVHDEDEMKIAIDSGAQLIGVNNRSLKTLETSLDVSRRLSRMKPEGSVLVCESGIRSGDQIQEMTRLGFDAFLVGSSLMATGSAGHALSNLIQEARNEARSGKNTS